jgi:hypothetical protein
MRFPAGPPQETMAITVAPAAAARSTRGRGAPELRELTRRVVTARMLDEARSSEAVRRRRPCVVSPTAVTTTLPSPGSPSLRVGPS